MSKLFARVNATAGFAGVNATILELGVAFSFSIELKLQKAVEYQIDLTYQLMLI